MNNDGTVVKEYKCPLFSVICLLFRLAPLHACQPEILNDSIASLQTHLCEKKYKVLHFSDETKTVLYETGQHSHATERDVSAVIKKEARAKLDNLLCRSEKCGPEALRTSLIAHFGESYQDMPALSQVRFNDFRLTVVRFWIVALIISHYRFPDTRSGITGGLGKCIA